MGFSLLQREPASAVAELAPELAHTFRILDTGGNVVSDADVQVHFAGHTLRHTHVDGLLCLCFQKRPRPHCRENTLAFMLEEQLAVFNTLMPPKLVGWLTTLEKWLVSLFN